MGNFEEADVVTIWSACGIPFFKQLEFWILYSWLQSQCFVGVKLIFGNERFQISNEREWYWKLVVIMSNYGSLDTKIYL